MKYELGLCPDVAVHRWPRNNRAVRGRLHLRAPRERVERELAAVPAAAAAAAAAAAIQPLSEKKQPFLRAAEPR